MLQGNISAVNVDTPDFWDTFYCEAEGRTAYEWYDRLDSDSAAFSDLEPVFKDLPSSAVLFDIGCGNSLALERLLAQKFGHACESVELVKLDYSEAAIDQLNELQCYLKAGSKPHQQQPKHAQKLISALVDKEDSDVLSWLAHAELAQADATRMPELWASWVGKTDIVFDKGCLDALLSTSDDAQQGSLAAPLAVVSSVYQMLRAGGKYLVVSRNDESVVYPYLFSSEENTWEDVKCTPVTGKHTTFVYCVRKASD